MVELLAKLGRWISPVLAAGMIVPSANADTIVYSAAGSTFSSLGNTLQTLGYDRFDTSQQDTRETFTVPGSAGSVVSLDFTFIQDVGAYQFSFGVFDYGAVTADPVSQREIWGSQALAAATEIFDNRNIAIGDTASLDVAAGTRLGWFLIPNDMLQTVLADPSGFYGSGRPDPLFSVSAANPGGFDQLLTFEAGGLTALAFEDLTRVGGSDQDFNDLVVTMRASIVTQSSVEVVDVPEPATGLLVLLAAGTLCVRRGRRARASRSGNEPPGCPRHFRP